MIDKRKEINYLRECQNETAVSLWEWPLRCQVLHSDTTALKHSARPFPEGMQRASLEEHRTVDVPKAKPGGISLERTVSVLCIAFLLVEKKKMLSYTSSQVRGAKGTSFWLQGYRMTLWLLGKSELLNVKTKGLLIYYLSMTRKAMGPAQYFIKGGFKLRGKEKMCCCLDCISLVTVHSIKPVIVLAEDVSEKKGKIFFLFFIKI